MLYCFLEFLLYCSLKSLGLSFAMATTFYLATTFELFTKLLTIIILFSPHTLA